MPKISVIVPVYNTEQYLPRCIDSILSQTFTDFELLLIDDGSKDNSGKICDEYAAKDSRIRVFHKENGGVSSARNMGLNNAQGEWITFVDSDDYLIEHSGFNLLARTDIEADLIVYSFLWNNELVRCPSSNHFEEIFFSYHSIVIWSKIYKRSIIQQNRLYFNEMIHLGEDQLWFSEYIKHTSTYLCNEAILYKYNCMENEISCLHNRKDSWEDISYRINLQKKAYKDLEKVFGVDCYNPIVRLLYNGLNNLLSSLSTKSFKEIYSFTKLFLCIETFNTLWNDSKCIPKGRKARLFDFIAKHKLYLFASVFIKLFRKY